VQVLLASPAPAALVLHRAVVPVASLPVATVVQVRDDRKWASEARRQAECMLSLAGAGVGVAVLYGDGGA
jgi:hypothetical protein